MNNGKVEAVVAAKDPTVPTPNKVSTVPTPKASTVSTAKVSTVPVSFPQVSYTFSDGGQYIGEVVENGGQKTCDGKGRMVWIDKNDSPISYEGYFKAHEAHGLGTDSAFVGLRLHKTQIMSFLRTRSIGSIVWGDSSKYTGELRKHCINGKG